MRVECMNAHVLRFMCVFNKSLPVLKVTPELTSAGCLHFGTYSFINLSAFEHPQGDKLLLCVSFVSLLREV